MLFAAMMMFTSCTTVDSGEIGIRFHKFAGDKENYGGVEGTVRGWVFYNPFTEDIFTYPTMVQRKNYEAFTVNAKDASVFTMDPQLAYHINPDKATDIFVKYLSRLMNLRTVILELVFMKHTESVLISILPIL